MSAISQLQCNNTDSILEVKIHNTQKPLKIDTTLECEALYYGYKLIQWAYMILPTKEYNPNKTKLQKDIDYYELPSDTYKGNIISFNPKEYLQSKENTRDTQTHQSSTTHISQANNTQESITTPNSQNANNNISNTTQTNTNTQITQQTHQSTQLAKLLSGEYTLILFAYQKTPAYKVKNYATHTKLDYNPPLSLRFNGNELEILEWGEVKGDKIFALNPFNLSNPKELILESKDYTINLNTLPIIISPREKYRLTILNTHNSNIATITNTNTQNIINPEIFIDDDFCKLIHILQQYKSQYKVSVVRLEVGYEGEVSERLSEHFWVKDMIQTSYGQMYIDLNKKFAMQPKHNKQLKKLCAELEKIRQFALNNGYMLQITSGVRCPELNKKLEPNASKTSQHLNASAADMIFVKNGISSKEGLKLIYKALYSNNPAERIQGIDRDKTFSQVIIERSKNSVWLHCAIFDDKYIANRRVTYGNHWVEKTEYRYSPNGQANNCPFLNDISDLDKI